MSQFFYCPAGQRLTDTFPFVHDGLYHAFSGIAPADRPWDWGGRYMEIGHAVSSDLVHWQQRSAALKPAGADRFDAVGVNVGCVIEHQGRFYSFYWCWARRTPPRVPSIGLAVSGDLDHWRRLGDGPVLQADPRWYEPEQLPDHQGGFHGCGVRDPFVFRDENDGRFHLTFAARTRSGPLDGRGCVGHAVSDDLVDWQACPPLLAPGLYSEMEVPQIFCLDGRWYLQFHSNLSLWLSAQGRGVIPSHEQIPAHLYWCAEQPLGPYRRLEEHVLIGNEPGICWPLVARIFTDTGGRPTLIHFNMGKDRKSDEGEATPGWLAWPKSITAADDGTLRCGVHPVVSERMGTVIFERTALSDGLGRNAGICTPDVFVAEVTLSLGKTGQAGLLLWCDRDISESKGYQLVVNGKDPAIELLQRRDRKVLARRPLARVPEGPCTLTAVVCEEFIDVFLDRRWLLTCPAYERQNKFLAWFAEGEDAAVRSGKVCGLDI